ncbi:ribosome-associated protein [Microbacteriaceae bacterium MWH-Ta3]|nr:ribosome-associated protein [Microbacteriaceae bacterium MWH-Ta3]
MTTSAETQARVELIARAADSMQGFDIVALDVSNPMPIVDAFVIITGRNERNVQAIAREIEDKISEAGGKTLRREGRAEGRWILLDFGDVVAHIFHEEERMYYGLERLWRDCPEIPFTIEAALSASAADSE